MQKVNIDLIPGEVNAIVYASQNDDGRTIRFELFLDDIGGTYTLDGNETITAKITKPDGTAITIPITNPGVGKHYVDLVNGTTDYDQDGVYVGEISFTDGDETIGSGNFVLKVEADPYDGKVQKKIVIDNPASFSTTLPDVLVSCKCKIDDANGIDSMDVINAGPTYAMNSVPYSLRQTPITANRCLEKLIGVSCAFNQLVQNGNFADSSHWEVYNSSNTSLSVADNEATLTMLTSGTGYAYGFRTTDIIFCSSGHKFIVFADFKVSKTGTYAFDIDGSANGKQFTINTANTYTTIAIMFGGEGVSGKRILIEPFNNTLAVGDTIKVKNVMLIDLTACFGSEVADYLYTLEQNTAGSGIALFRQLFPEDYYAYQTATLISSKPVSKVIKDSNDATIATYPLGGDELRGVLKVENGNLVAVGDVKGSDGIIYRYFEERAYASGDESLPNAITDGTNTVVKLATPTTSSGTAFTNPMISGSTEEFTDSRSLKMFCGHDSVYADNISFAHIDFGQSVTDGTLDVVHGILTPTGGSPVSVTPASIKTFSGVNNVFSNGGGNITAIYLDTL